MCKLFPKQYKRALPLAGFFIFAPYPVAKQQNAFL
jgi:hypothetical protein